MGFSKKSYNNKVQQDSQHTADSLITLSEDVMSNVEQHAKTNNTTVEKVIQGLVTRSFTINEKD
mgnify:CR=1 FL=1